MSKNRLYRTFIPAMLLVALTVLQACSGRRGLVDKPPTNKSASFLIKKLEANQNDYEWLSGKVATKLTFAGKTHRFKSSLRVRKDSCIWVSMSPAMGIEAARLVITKDSVKLVNKLDKTFYLNSIEKLNEQLNTSVSYDLLEDFIAGRAVAFDFEDGKYKSSVDTGQLYILTSKNPRIVRKSIQLDEEKDRRRFEQDSTMQLLLDEEKLDKALGRRKEDELFLLRYWMDAEEYRLRKVLIHDLRINGRLEINYDDYKAVDSLMIPHESSLNITDGVKDFNVEFTYSKIKLNKAVSFPFKIPSRYEEVTY